MRAARCATMKLANRLAGTAKLMGSMRALSFTSSIKNSSTMTGVAASSSKSSVVRRVLIQWAPGPVSPPRH